MIICLNLFCLDEGGERRTGPSEWEGACHPWLSSGFKWWSGCRYVYEDQRGRVDVRTKKKGTTPHADTRADWRCGGCGCEVALPTISCGCPLWISHAEMVGFVTSHPYPGPNKSCSLTLASTTKATSKILMRTLLHFLHRTEPPRASRCWRCYLARVLSEGKYGHIKITCGAKEPKKDKTILE